MTTTAEKKQVDEETTTLTAIRNSYKRLTGKQESE